MFRWRYGSFPAAFIKPEVEKENFVLRNKMMRLWKLWEEKNGKKKNIGALFCFQNYVVMGRAQRPDSQ